MDQGIIAKTKRCFRHKLMQYVFRNENGVKDFYTKYTIKDCIDIINTAWNEVTQNNIRNAWNKIIPQSQMETEAAVEEEEEEKMILQMQHTCTQFSEQNITIHDISDYLSICTAEESRYPKEADGADQGTSQDKDEITEMIEEKGEERKRVEDAFSCLDEFKNRYSLPTQFIITGLKLEILGNI
nr:PREDICTED: jerky protein homolog-like [Megachile rotundata]